MNFALEKYAHRLSAEALKGLIGLYEISGCSGNCTNKLRVERLLQHLHYSPELINEILAKFPKKEEDLRNDDDDDDDRDEMQLDAQCEAEMLAKLLNVWRNSGFQPSPL